MLLPSAKLESEMANGWGGKRVGAGRPIGSKDKYAKGMYRAMRTMRQGERGPRRWRVPDDAPEELKELADLALTRIEDVMQERVDPKQAQAVLRAAASIREEVCGPVARKIEVGGSLEMLLTEIHTHTHVLMGAESAEEKALPASSQILDLSTLTKELQGEGPEKGESRTEQRRTKSRARSTPSEDV